MRATVMDPWAAWQHTDGFRHKARQTPSASWTKTFLARQRERIAVPPSDTPDGAEGIRERAVQAVLNFTA